MSEVFDNSHEHRCEYKPDTVTIRMKYDRSVMLGVTVGGLAGFHDETAYATTISFEIRFCPFCGCKVVEK